MLALSDIFKFSAKDITRLVSFFSCNLFRWSFVKMLFVKAIKGGIVVKATFVTGIYNACACALLFIKEK